MKTKQLLVCLLLVAILLLNACSTTNSKTTEVYTIATGSNYVPFSFLNEKTGELEGFEIDLMKAIAKEADFEISFELIEWEGFILALQKGHYDMGIYGVTITEDRKAKVDFSEPYYNSGLTILVDANNQEIKSERDLAGKKVGTVTHTTSEDYLRKNHPEAEVLAFSSSPELYMELGSGRIDAVLYDIPSIKYFMTREQGIGFKIVGDTLQGENYGILFPKESHLLERTNKALRALIAKGIYDDIYEKWFKERPFGTK